MNFAIGANSAWMIASNAVTATFPTVPPITSPIPPSSPLITWPGLGSPSTHA